MKEKASNFFNEWYGSKETQDKGILWTARIMMLLTFVFFALLLFQKQEMATITKWLYIYITTLTFSVSLFMFAYYFFQDKRTALKCKLLKFVFLIITLVLVAVIFLPVTIFMGILNITKFQNIWRYYMLYALCFIITLSLSIIVWYISFSVSLKLYCINPVVVATCIAFAGNNAVTRIFFYCYFWVKKKRIEKRMIKRKLATEIYIKQMELCVCDYEQSKKEIYVFTFVIITLVAIGTSCLDWKLIFENLSAEKANGIVKDVSSSFALYIAFDRLYDKWKKTHMKSKNICDSCINYIVKADD